MESHADDKAKAETAKSGAATGDPLPRLQPGIR